MRGFGAGRWWYPALRRPPPHPFDPYHRSTSSPPIRPRGAQFFAKLVASPSTGLASLREDADKSTTRAADFIVTAPANFGPRPAPRASDARYPSYPPPASAVLLPDPPVSASGTPGARGVAATTQRRNFSAAGGSDWCARGSANGSRHGFPAAGCGDGPALVVRACVLVMGT